jgi:methylglutaconyl-CoA hydratase
MSLIRTETRGGVATLTLDSPANRNALSAALITELLSGLAAAQTDATVRVIVLSHTGPAFCSGADLRETAAAVAAGELPVAGLGDVLTAVTACPKPVVARVGGPARAGGIGLIAAADIAVCTEDATFSFSEVRLGVVPAVISSTVLPILSPRAAAELYLTGATFDGRRAAQVGLVTAAVPADRLDDTVAGFCADLVRGAPGALAGAKALLRERRTDLAYLTPLSLEYFQSDEGREGVTAYWEKRDPAWVPEA